MGQDQVTSGLQECTISLLGVFLPVKHQLKWSALKREFMHKSGLVYLCTDLNGRSKQLVLCSGLQGMQSWDCTSMASLKPETQTSGDRV